MSLSEAWQNVETHLKADLESVKARVEQDLPVVASAIEKAQNSPVVQALEQAAHVSAAPEAVSLIVSFISGLDAALGAAKAQAAAEAQQPPADPSAPSA